MPPKHKKLLQRAKDSPRGWRLRELITLYKGFGFEIRELSRHTSVSHPEFLLRTTVPRHPNRELDPNYVRYAVKLIENLLDKQNFE